MNWKVFFKVWLSLIGGAIAIVFGGVLFVNLLYYLQGNYGEGVAVLVFIGTLFLIFITAMAWDLSRDRSQR